MRRVLALACVAAAGCTAAAEAVVGGRAVKPSASPWMATLPDCGATLVAPDRVLTAAHCVNGLGPEDLQNIVFGDGTARKGARVAVHPAYVQRALDGTGNLEAPRDDIAIVQLDAPVKIAPLVLASAAQVTAGKRVDVLGRGLTSPPPKRRARAAAAPSNLRQAQLKIAGDATCRAFYANAPKIYRKAFHAPTMLCAADPDRARRPQRSACVRDSGGPLVAGTGASRRLAGVVSWGERCGAERDPTVFTQVTAYRAFVTAAEPVWAPVAGPGAVVITGEARVGATLTCTPPPWTTPPDTVRFTWSAYRYQQGNPTRQSGPSNAYVVRAADRGRSVQCTVTGATKGGLAGPPPTVGPRIPA